MSDKNSSHRPGRVYLIPNTLGAAAAASIPPANAEILRGLRHFAAENPRRAFRSLRELGYDGDLKQVTVDELSEHTPASDIPRLLDPVLRGQDLGILSEAGLPCIADPGEELVLAAHRHGVAVIPLAGPCSLVLALAASGLPAEKFSVCGYLPRPAAERKAALKQLEKSARQTGYSQVFIEAPYRSDALLEDAKEILDDNTLLSISCNLTAPDQWTRTLAIADWRREQRQIGKLPSVFVLFAL